MFAIAGKSCVNNCCVYVCLVCYGNTLKHRCLIYYDVRYKVCNVVARVITWFESVRQRRVFLTGRHYGVRNGVSSPAEGETCLD